MVVGAGETKIFGDGKQIAEDDWSRDGKLLIFHEATTVFSLPLTGEHKPQQLFQATAAQVDQFRLSPDQHWDRGHVP